MIALAVPRLALAVIIGLIVAIGAGLNTTSMIATKTAPELAVQLFPANGEAYDNLAFDRFSEAAAEDPTDLLTPAAAAREDALSALRRDPISPKALTLLSLAMDDEPSRSEAALAAGRLNRRDLALQGLVLETYLESGNYDRSIETLDAILRVHPTYDNRFFPVLGQALADQRTIPVFERILDGSSPWHERFIGNYSIRQDDLLTNLAQLRVRKPLAGREFDQSLVRKLAARGDIEAALAVFRAVEGNERNEDLSSGLLGWSGEFPPFDWRFVDEGDFRAQPSRDGERLELFARPGKGGVIAERIIPIPEAPFTVRLTQESENARQAEDVRIEMTCPGAAEPFLVAPLAQGANAIAVEASPGCPQARLAINARAFTGRATLRTELGTIELKSR